MSKLSKENAQRALAVVNSRKHGNEVYVFSDGEYFANKRIANSKVSVKGSYTVVPKAEVKKIAEGKDVEQKPKSQGKGKGKGKGEVSGSGEEESPSEDASETEKSSTEGEQEKDTESKK